MDSVKIPTENADLVKYARNRNNKYLLLYVLYIAFFASAYWFYISGRHEDLEPLGIWVLPVYSVVVVISGWFVCLMNRFVFDRTFSGEILSMSFFRNYDRGLSRRATVSLGEHTYVKMVVRDLKGRRRKIRIMLFDDGYDGYFSEGKQIIKYRGLNYPICPDSEKNGVHLCPVCGVRTHYKEGKAIHGEAMPEMRGNLIVCRSCGHTLINIESWEAKK